MSNNAAVLYFEFPYGVSYAVGFGSEVVFTFPAYGTSYNVASHRQPIEDHVTSEDHITSVDVTVEALMSSTSVARLPA